MQRLFIAIVISSCTALPAAAQSFSYYPADADHVFLWSDESPEAIRVERVRGKWSVEGTPLRNGKWPSLLARALKSGDRKDASTALDDMVAGEADKSVAVLRLPNAHALFIKRGDSRLLLIGNTATTSIEVTFDKIETGWTKGKANVPLGSWLGTKDEIKAAEMLRGIFASVPSPSNNNWPPFWNAIATQAAASTGCRAITYGHTPAPEWFLVEFSDGAATVVDRVHRYAPPAYRVFVIVKEKALIPGTETPSSQVWRLLSSCHGSFGARNHRCSD